MQYLCDKNPVPKPLHLLRESRWRYSTEREHKWSPKGEMAAPLHNRRHILRRYPTRIRQADGSQGQIPVKENHLSPVQTSSNHHEWRNNLSKSIYRSLTSRTLWTGDPSAERSAEPPQPQENLALDFDGVRANISAANIRRMCYVKKSSD